MSTNSHDSIQLIVGQLHASLQKLVGFHRQLLETVRAEKIALVDAEVRAIRETTCAKQSLIEAIRFEENIRLVIVAGLAKKLGRPVRELSLNQIILEVQGGARDVEPKVAEQLRTAFNALTHLVKRVVEQNQENSEFVERSLAHIGAMKKNVLGEAAPSKQTYTQQGTRAQPAAGARLISKEA